MDRVIPANKIHRSHIKSAPLKTSTPKRKETKNKIRRTRHIPTFRIMPEPELPLVDGKFDNIELRLETTYKDIAVHALALCSVHCPVQLPCNNSTQKSINSPVSVVGNGYEELRSNLNMIRKYFQEINTNKIKSHSANVTHEKIESKDRPSNTCAITSHQSGHIERQRNRNKKKRDNDHRQRISIDSKTGHHERSNTNKSGAHRLSSSDEDNSELDIANDQIRVQRNLRIVSSSEDTIRYDSSESFDNPKINPVNNQLNFPENRSSTIYDQQKTDEISDDNLFGYISSDSSDIADTSPGCIRYAAQQHLLEFSDPSSQLNKRADFIENDVTQLNNKDTEETSEHLLKSNIHYSTDIDYDIDYESDDVKSDDSKDPDYVL